MLWHLIKLISFLLKILVERDPIGADLELAKRGLVTTETAVLSEMQGPFFFWGLWRFASGDGGNRFVLLETLTVKGEIHGQGCKGKRPSLNMGDKD